MILCSKDYQSLREIESSRWQQQQLRSFKDSWIICFKDWPSRKRLQRLRINCKDLKRSKKCHNASSVTIWKVLNNQIKSKINLYKWEEDSNCHAVIYFMSYASNPGSKRQTHALLAEKNCNEKSKLMNNDISFYSTIFKSYFKVIHSKTSFF